MGNQKEERGEVGNIISVKTEDLEKAVTLMNVIAGCVNFHKKFQITIKYDPELLNTKIKYQEITNA